jgi:hypothetical protein
MVSYGWGSVGRGWEGVLYMCDMFGWIFGSFWSGWR